MNSRANERRALLCQPVTAVPHPGDHERACTDCGRGLWVEAQLVQHVDSGRVEPLCSACVHTVMTQVSGMSIGVLPGQEADYADLGLNVRAGSEFLPMLAGSSVYRVMMDAIGEMARDEH